MHSLIVSHFRESPFLCDDFLYSHRVGLLIINNIVFPEGNSRHLSGVVHVCLSFFFCQSGDLLDPACDILDYILVVGIVPRDHGYARMVLRTMLLHPQSEPCQSSGGSRHLECKALQRGIAPRLVI